jgi:hypothetical protein
VNDIERAVEALEAVKMDAAHAGEVSVETFYAVRAALAALLRYKVTEGGV